MGLRGPGAARLKRARGEVEKKRTRRPEWQKKGLKRYQRVIKFIESLPVTKGKLQGKKIRLLPNQRAFIRSIYERPRRNPVRLGVKSEPRGNGKTGLVAGLALCHLLGPEAEPRGEVYSAGIDRRQAGILFAEMEAIIYAVPDFASRCNIQRFFKKIEVLDGLGDGSIYEALSQDARRAHGLAPTFWAYDEFAQAKDRELFDNLQTAMGKRKRSLGMVISTQAPSDEHPLSQLIDDGLSGADPSIFVQLITAPEDVDPFDPDVIRKHNPAMNIFLDEGDVMADAARARRIPAFEPAYRNLRLNQRVDANEEHRIVTAQVWAEGAEPVDYEALLGRTCYGGLDLSGKKDLTALVLVFPEDGPDPAYDVLPFFWTPEDQLARRRPREEQRFREWIAEGFMEAIPGPIIRYAAVARELIEICERFDVRAISYDAWRIDDLKVEISEIGGDVPLESFGGQGIKVMAPAVDTFAEYAETGRILHGGHPVLTAAVVNAILTPDRAGNLTFDKEKGNRAGPVRIDGAVALAMALHTARRFEGEEVPTPSAVWV